MLVLVLAILTGLVMAIAGRMQVTTLWAGRAIAPPGTEQQAPNGLQDAITPRWQTWLNLGYMVGFLAILILGSMRRWYLGVGGIAGALLSQIIIGDTLLPKAVAPYLRLIAADLAKREARYNAKGDVLRAGIARDLWGKLQTLLSHAADIRLAVPSSTEARRAIFGQVE